MNYHWPRWSASAPTWRKLKIQPVKSKLRSFQFSIPNVTPKQSQTGTSLLTLVRSSISHFALRNNLADCDVLVYVSESNSFDNFVTFERSAIIQLIPLSEITFDFWYHVTVLDDDDVEVFVSDFFGHSANDVIAGKPLDGTIKVDKLHDVNLNLKIVIIKKEGDSFDGLNESTVSKNKSFSDNEVKDLLADFKRLYRSMEGADIELVAQGESFPAHKLILCARSPYFKKLFEEKSANMNSNMNGNISMNSTCFCNVSTYDFEDDCTPQVMREFVRYLYYSEVKFKNMNKAYQTLELFKLAEKFGVKGLVKLSLKHLTKDVHGLFMNDIVEVMELAYSRKLDPLFELSVIIFFR